MSDIPEVRRSSIKGAWGVGIGEARLFLYVEHPGDRWRFRVVEPVKGGSSLTAWVSLDGPEQLRRHADAKPIRDAVTREYPEVLGEILEKVIGVIQDNPDEWPREEAAQPPPDLEELLEKQLEKMGAVEIHPLIDYHPVTGLTMGGLLGPPSRNLIISEKWAAVSDSKGLVVREENAISYQVRRPTGCALRRTHWEQILHGARDLDSGQGLSPKPEKEVFQMVFPEARLYWYHSDERWHLAIACWTIGTYMFPVFNVYPTLHLQGERESGKTTLLMLLSRLAWNPTSPEAALREANLFRTIEGSRVTYLVDVTRLSGSDPEMRDVVDVFEAGYQRGAAISRCDPDTQEPRKYEVYSPKAIATREELPFEAKDIRIVTEKAPDPAFTEKSIYILDDPKMADIVGVLIRSALTSWPKVQEEYWSLRQTERLRGRRFQLWQPLLAVCRVYAPDRFEELLSLAEWDALQAEPGDRQSEVEEAVLSVLHPTIDKSPTWLLKDLTKEVQGVLDWVKSYHPVRSAITNLGIVKRRYSTRQGKTYQFDPVRVKAKAETRGLTAGGLEKEIPEAPQERPPNLQEDLNTLLRKAQELKEENQGPFTGEELREILAWEEDRFSRILEIALGDKVLYRVPGGLLGVS